MDLFPKGEKSKKPRSFSGFPLSAEDAHHHWRNFTFVRRMELSI